ncbi:MAG TPA: endolytic transglycosylase MltG [Aestuariivirgaceae bacterium]
MAEQKRAKRRRRSFGRVLASLAGILLVAGALAGVAALYGRTAFEEPGPLAENRIFAVARGMSTPEIAAALEEAGIISDDKVFLAAAYASGNHQRMKAGEYAIPQRVSMAEVMALIVSGRELVYKVTVPEGWTVAQVVERVSAHENLEGPVTAAPAEGTILPETYVFRRGMTRDALIEQMRAAQAVYFDELWKKRAPNLPFDTKDEALILASIVEKETAVPAERPLIAAVFINRLRNGMRLQSDPTIIYGITGGKTKLDRPILKSDIEETTPYNTYRITGLPPTPIANPGKESIAAVLNPADSKALYFVADGTGGHVFAATLEEHRRNVRKWRAVERSLAEEASVETSPGEAEAAPEAPAQTQAASAPQADPEGSAPAQVPLIAEPPHEEEASEPLLEGEAAPAETADFDDEAQNPAAAQKTPEAAAGASQAAAAPAEPKVTRLVVVSGRLVPIPAKRPSRN